MEVFKDGDVVLIAGFGVGLSWAYFDLEGNMIILTGASGGIGRALVAGVAQVR